jgi:polysaccharide biosynthesis protein PslH
MWHFQGHKRKQVETGAVPGILPAVRILVLSPTLPLPFGSADARWLYVILAELAQRSIDVTCISCTENDEFSVLEARKLAEDCGFDLVHIPLQLAESRSARKMASAIRPLSEYRRCDELKRVLDEQCSRGYDILHVEHLFPSWVTEGRAKTVVYVHHLEVIDWARRNDLTRQEWVNLWQMRRATWTLLRRSERVITASDRLAKAARGYQKDLIPEVVPIALEPSLYPSLEEVASPVVGVIGSMHWYPSRSAAERVLTVLWPQIHQRVPEAELFVAGWGSDKYLSKYFPLYGASLLGPVDSPVDFFSRISLLLYPPARGSGMKVKVLEAFAYGLPVVSNEEGFEGLDFVDSIDACRAETDNDFVDRVVGLLSDSVRRRQMGLNARNLIEQRYSPVPTVDRLLGAYDRLGLMK